MIGKEDSGGLVVAQLIESMGMGGAENLAVRIANSLAGQGHRSHLIVLGEEGILSRQVRPEVHTHYLGFARASIKNPPAFAGSLLRGHNLLRQLLDSQGIQVLQTHLPGSNFWGLLLSLRGWRPVLATIHNNQEFRYGDADNPLRARLRKEAYKLILHKGAGTVAVSDEVKTSLIRDLGVGDGAAGRIGVVRNGVAIPEALTQSAVQEVRDRLGVPAGRPFLLAAGRLSDQKNFGDLVSAAACLKKQTSDFFLAICGEGEHRVDLEAMVEGEGLQGHVVLPGNRTDLEDLMLAADIFVMTSLWEGLPLVLLEAMASGLPGVGYGIKGVDELIQPGVNGLTVTTGNVEAMAEALEKLIADPATRKSMGVAARILVAEQFNFEDLIGELVAFYRRALTPQIQTQKS